MRTREPFLCPVCGGGDCELFLSLPSMPVLCNVLWESRARATAAVRGDIELVHCSSCGFIANTAFDPARIEYTESYDNCLHFSGRFQEYAESLARRLVERHHLRRKTVVDVGCGKGDFLKLLCDLGGNHGIGFDPSFAPRDDMDPELGDIRIIRDYYSENYADHGGDFVSCRHVLEHIQRPGEFLDKVRRGISRPGVPVYFEVPNATYTMEHTFVWDVIYEHPCYFTHESLRYVFEKSGFAVDEVADEFEGQYLGLHAKTRDPSTQPVEKSTRASPAVRELVKAFAARFRGLTGQWTRELDSVHSAGRRAVVWGAGSKGVTFLNLLDPRRRMEYAVDVSPNKHGKFVAGSGHEIVPPVFLRDYRPGLILVMNPVYEAEIRRISKEMGVDAEIRCL